MRKLLALLLLAPLLVWAQATNQANLARFSGRLNGGNADVGTQNFGVSGGYSSWSPQGDANWNIVQTSIPYNPTEWQVYPNAAEGIAQSQNGTGNLVLQSGTPFSASWVGLPYFYFGGALYKVSAFTSSSQVTVQTTSGGTVTFGSTANNTYYFLTTSATATCNVSGTAVTWSAGQPFIPFFDLFFINGAAFTISSYNSQTSLTLSSNAGSLTGATCVQYKNINNELSTLRLQGLYGSNEENFAISETPAGTYIGPQYAGSGQYRAVIFEAGEDPAGTQQVMLSMRPNPTLGSAGTLGIGGDTNAGNQAIEVIPNPSAVNYWLAQGAATGVAPSLACRGTDTTVGCGFDMQGANTMSFTSHSFGQVEFQIFGNGGTSWLGTGSSSSGNPTLGPQGAASNINLELIAKGTGTVNAVSPVQLPRYTITGLPSCSSTIEGAEAVVTNGVATPAYLAAVSATGSTVVKVLCNGMGWIYD